MQTQMMDQTLDTTPTPSTVMPIVLVIACWIGTISAVAFIVTPFL